MYRFSSGKKGPMPGNLGLLQSIIIALIIHQSSGGGDIRTKKQKQLSAGKYKTTYK
jgi:hypothetical protein